MSGASDKWNPRQYEQFREERAQPFHDLMALIDLNLPIKTIVDLGCGTGEWTADLHRHVQQAQGPVVSTLGLDNSPAMLARSAESACDGLTFAQQSIEDFATDHAGSEPVDVLFSNAAYQWVPSHTELFPALLRCVKPRGQFAAQMPCNGDHPSHTIAARVAAEPRFAEALGGHVRHSPVLAPEEYALMLGRAGCREMQVRMQVYLHWLADREGMLEWVKGTLLTDYEKRLSGEDFQAFLGVYREILSAEVPDEKPFPFTFKRILMWARLPG